MQDVRFAVRTLRQRPAFTIVAILVLAVGIGATTSVFSVVDAVVLRPMPYPDAERLAVLWESNDTHGMPFMNVAPPNLADWRERSRAFEAIGAWTPRSFTIQGDGPADQVRGAALTHDVFGLLNVQPIAGRVFKHEEYVGPGANVALISHGLWRRAFGADSGMVGRTLRVNGVAREIVGIMPEGFNFPPPVAFEGVPAPSRNDLWIPLAADNLNPQRGAHYLLVLGRLKRGVSVADAERELRDIASQIAVEHPDSNQGWSVRVVPFGRQVTGDQRPALVAVGLAVVLVLLLSCANVAAMALARGIGRRRELAIRSALGATRSRIVRQLLTESVVLAGAGALAGTILASWAVYGVRMLGGPLLPRLDEVMLDRRAVFFAIVASVVAALVFGILPALQQSKEQASQWLRHRGAGLKTVRMQSTLVIVELALSIVLLSAAGLLGSAFVRLVRTDPGFRPDNVLTAHLTLPQVRYPDRAQRAAFLERVLERVRSGPGVEAAGAIDAAPLADDRQGTGFVIDGEAPTPAIEAANVNFAFVTSGYFETLGIPVLRGRAFTSADNATSVPVIIINQTFARRFFGDRDPIGRKIRTGFNTQTPREIVGVVGDERHIALDSEPPPGMYTTFAQSGWNREISLALRTRTSTAQAASAFREAVQSVDRSVPLYDVRTMNEVVADSVSRPRFAVLLLGIFGFVALLLSAVGTFGVISQAVGERVSEFGVRLALGAAPAQLRALVVRFGLRLAAVSALVGVPAAIAFGRVLSRLFTGVHAADPVIYGGVALGLGLTALLAALVPARRAARVDPIVALRAE